MTYNVKDGGDIVAFLRSTDPTPVRWATQWSDIQATNFRERAGAIARQIELTSPALIGLEEMSLFRTQDPADPYNLDPAAGPLGYGPGATAATNIALDYLAILLDSLAARGLSYYVAASQNNFDIEFPARVATDPIHTIDVRETDRNVILARSDIETSAPIGGVFVKQASAPVDGKIYKYLRGWVSTLATVGGVTYRVVDAHIERASFPTTHTPQLQELVALLNAETRPLILTCDCNSDATGADGSQGYALLTGSAGMLDAWAEAHPRDPGYTSRLPQSLFGPANLTERIDYVFVRQGFGAAPAAGIVGGVHAIVIGEEEADKTPSGRWPSDHAGVVAILQTPKALANP